MPRSTRPAERRRRALLALAPLLLAGCLGTTPERARISHARLLDDGRQLEVTQQLSLSKTMLSALGSGIALRLVYRIDACDGRPRAATVELRYVALTGSYELQRSGDPQVRRFGRRSALLAALDRLRLPLQPAVPGSDCAGEVAVALDLTSLPTPLRFPALLQPERWRLISPPQTWLAARA